MGGQGIARSRFGRYELVRRVSIGGMAEIFKAKAFGPSGFQKIVALKRLLPHVEENAEFVAMFVAEAQLVAQLDHPAIAGIHEVGRVDGVHYIAMEYIYGRDLGRVQRLLADNKLRADPVLVAALGLEAAVALAYVHEACDAAGRALDVVHRDVSPQNLMLTHNGELKLIDFGIAKFAGNDNKTRDGVVKGKHAYMSPEQVHRRPLDGRSDLFSLGTILWELCAGRRLFKADSVLETLSRVEAADVAPLTSVAPGVPVPLAEVIMTCLKAAPDERPDAARDVAVMLRGVLAGLADREPRDVLTEAYRALFGDAGVAEDEVSIDEYQEALRAARLGEDPGLMARNASDITIVPDTDDLAAYVEALRARLSGSEGT